MLGSAVIVTGWVHTRLEYKQDGCSFQFESERFDPIRKEVFAFKGDHLVGDEMGFRGAVSLEWSQVDVDEYRKAPETATRDPFCSATAVASFVRDPSMRLSSNGMIGSAAEAALAAGRGE